MKVFIHIGMSKAGSSAVQRCLMENQGILARHGISYPSVGISEGAHHGIDGDLRSESTTVLRRALDHSSGDVVVLSCEAFWVLNDDMLELLARALSEHEVMVVFYLRNPHDYLPSSYRQKIKRGEHYTPEEYFEPSRRIRNLDFSYQLERWSQYFSLRVRAYEAVKRGIEKDFMEVIGAPMDQVDTSRRVVNTTPSDGAIHLMRLVNRYLPPQLGSYTRRLIRRSGCDFNVMPPIEDAAFHQYAEAIIQRWDTEVLREHLPEQDWNLLVDQYN